MRDVNPAGEQNGEMLAAVSNLVVGTFADHAGRGPTRARSYASEDVLVCVVEDTMTAMERSLLACGKEKTLTEVRMDLREAMRNDLVAGVERVTGTSVRACIGDSCLRPDLAAVLFVVEPPRRRPSGNGGRST